MKFAEKNMIENLMIQKFKKWWSKYIWYFIKIFSPNLTPANFLGLGWAATSAGLKAMEELGKLNHGSPVASNAMCNFLILNISSLQLIPVNVIAFRSQYGSVNPTAIVGAGIVATAISTGTAIVFCKIMDRKKTRKS